MSGPGPTRRLYDYAKNNGLTEHVQEVFEFLGTNNFEGVIRLLEDATWVRDHYGLAPTPGAPIIEHDLESVRVALVRAVAETHLERPGDIEEERLERCSAFLAPFHNIFTTNYDLLLYWVAVHGLDQLDRRDGFRAPLDEPNAEHLVFQEHVRRAPGMFFLHGALHLFMAEGEIRKNSWRRSGKTLIDLVQEGLAEERYPLFVAEGLAKKKFEQIQRNAYLAYCLSKLSRIEAPLVVYGLSFGETDDHVIRTLVENRALSEIFVGLHGAWDSAGNEAIRTRCESMSQRRQQLVEHASGFQPLKVEYFDSTSAHVWDAPV